MCAAVHVFSSVIFTENDHQFSCFSWKGRGIMIISPPSASRQGLHGGVWDEDYGAQTGAGAFGSQLPSLISPSMAVGQPTHPCRAPQCSHPPALDTHGAPASSAAALTQNPGAGSLQGAPARQQEVRFWASVKSLTSGVRKEQTGIFIPLLLDSILSFHKPDKIWCFHLKKGLIM